MRGFKDDTAHSSTLEAHDVLLEQLLQRKVVAIRLRDGAEIPEISGAGTDTHTTLTEALEDNPRGAVELAARKAEDNPDLCQRIEVCREDGWLELRLKSVA